jgi:hypothetical protein
VDHRDSNPSGLLDLLLTLLTGPSLNILDGLLLKSDDPNNCFEVSPDEDAHPSNPGGAALFAGSEARQFVPPNMPGG